MVAVMPGSCTISSRRSRPAERHVLTSAADSLVSHLLAFAAEEARVSQRVVDMSAYLEQVGA